MPLMMMDGKKEQQSPFAHHIGEVELSTNYD